MTRVTRRAQRVNIPALRDGDKDVTDYWRAGGDLRAWLSDYLGDQPASAPAPALPQAQPAPGLPASLSIMDEQRRLYTLA